MSVLTLDNHKVLREGLAALPRQAGPAAVAAQAGDVAGGLGPAAKRSDLDVVVLDLILPGMGGMAR